MTEVTDLLRELAEALGTTVDYLWPVLVSAQPVKGVVGLVSLLLLISLTVVCARVVVRNIPDMYGSAAASVGVVVGGVVGFVAFAISMGLFSKMSIHVLQILNPEYAALQEVLRLL